MKRSFIIISMDRCAYDFDILSEYLCRKENVLRVSYTTDGFFIDFCYETDAERKMFIGMIMKLDVNKIEIYDVLYEEFLKIRGSEGA
jgi:hypothetical protein